MATNDASEIQLLAEIRDLLIPIASYYRPGYEKQLQEERQQRAEQLPKIVRGDQARKAVLMMASGKDQSAIRAATGIASGNLSNLIGRLDEGGYLATDDRKKPQLIFGEDEVANLFLVSN